MVDRFDDQQCKMEESRKLNNVRTKERSSMYKKLNNELRREIDWAREEWRKDEYE